MPGAKSRWSQGKDLSWEPLRPELVVEVAYDHMEGTRFRHTAHFRRWRPDKDPRDCTYAQLEVVAPHELAAIFATGIARMTFKDLFSERPDPYARYRPTYPAAVFEWLAAQAPSTVLAVDVGTGNGQAAVALAEHFDRVLGLDPSEAQLANARAHPRVEYRRRRPSSSRPTTPARTRSSSRRRCTGSSTTLLRARSAACSCPAACSPCRATSSPRSRRKSTRS